MADYTKPDFWSQKAQKEGYPARSVYKLKEMDEKFRLLDPPGRGGRGLRILDLGAAPGSWSLYILRKFTGRTGGAGALSLTAVDLSPLPPRFGRDLAAEGGFTFIQGDISAAEIREAILARGPFSLILSDAAPATTGNRSVDALRSLELAETALFYGGQALEPGGALAVKVFQGGDSQGLLKKIRELFESGKSFKPQACRRESFETYYLGLGKR
ncbi:MAG: RlmE family RNA methyltransferase [Treponema sp.]|jgi:23S rRNA (uridine2552-2'-O)-methyltransferase|nr:RlmE family RNA methyltransferase [Treponema sp.]